MFISILKLAKETVINLRFNSSCEITQLGIMYSILITLYWVMPVVYMTAPVITARNQGFPALLCLTSLSYV